MATQQQKGQQQPQQPVSRREGREGSRWVNMRPSGEEVAEWFEANVQLHNEGLDHSHYVQGLTLIQQKGREKEVVGWDGAKPLIDDVDNLFYVPYAKVETRVAYFWDYMALHPEWLGIIEPVPPTEPSAGLPPSFGRLSVALPDKGLVNYVTCSMRVRVLERETVTQKVVRNSRTGEPRTIVEGRAIMEGAPGSKMSAVLDRWNKSDPFALMKAETGAVGRALGLLGMLVIPGSGVASAEDMQEAGEGAQGGAVPADAGEQPQLPMDDDDTLRTQAKGLAAKLRELDQERHKALLTWMRDDRKIDPESATGPQLRGIVRKLEEQIAEANAAAQQQEVAQEAE